MTGTDRTDINGAAFHEKLRDQLARLDEVEAISKENQKPVELDQTTQGRLSRMDALQVQAMASATARRRKVERQRIIAALARWENGEYGYCAVCGENVPKARLEHDPSVPTCVACAGA